MLLYHPAYDLYHCIFRTLKILSYSENGEFEYDRLSILDFYLLFPQLITDISLPQNLVTTKRRFKRYSSNYDFRGDAKFFFSKLRALQDTALRVMVGKGLISREHFENQTIKLIKEDIPLTIQRAIVMSSQKDEEILHFLVETISGIELRGAGGLKNRTGLLEYRYDEYT